MENNILVAYGSKYGATAEIAKKIGDILKQNGFNVEVLSADQVKNPGQYKAFIIGSAVYIGQWRKEASNFIKTNEKILSQNPVWIFSSGPTGEGDAVELMQGWVYPPSLKTTFENIKPRGITAFHGSIDSKKMNFLEKLAIKNVKAKLGDFRDWNGIESWASSIAETLKK